MHLHGHGKSAWHLWYAFAVCVALPAAVLAVLSCRAVKLENLERQQEFAQQQAQASMLADAAMTAGLQSVERSALDSADSFELDDSGALVFPRDRVWFATLASPRELAPPLTPAVTALIDQAEAAEAQGRREASISVYSSLIAYKPLAQWASLAVARVCYSEDPGKLRAWAQSFGKTGMDDLSPEGFPVALIAAGFFDRLPPPAVREFTPLLQLTAGRLSHGQWWLSGQQRRLQYKTLEHLLPIAGAKPTEPDTRAVFLAGVEAAIRQAGPFRQDGPTRTTIDAPAGPILLLAFPRSDKPGTWQGAVYTGRTLEGLLNRELGLMRREPALPVAIREQNNGRLIWGDRSAAGLIAPFRSLPGWTVTIGSPASQSTRGRQILSYSLVVLLVLVLTFGIVITLRAVSREGELARLQSAFAAGVTHEFKSPITTIQLLMERVAGGRITSPESLKEYSNAICRETSRLELLVNRLLQTHKIEAGESRYHTAPHSLHDIALTAAAHFQAQADSRGIRIDIDADDLTREVELDRTAIQDCLQNLIDNAIKYSPNETRIEVIIRHDRQQAHVVVRDQGIGIESSELATIFNRFYRGRKGVEQCAKGTGLGLWLVKAVVEGHGGKVEVQSSPGRGSEFHIMIPLRESLPCLES